MTDSTWPEIHLHFHAPAENTEVLTAITNLANQLATETTTIMADLTQVQADVTAQTTVVDSAVTLLQQLDAALVAAGTDPAALAALHDSISANTDALAAAVTANTPAA